MKLGGNTYKLRLELVVKYTKPKEKKLIESVEIKRNWINNKIKQIEEASNKSETRKFFKETYFFNKQQLV